MSVQCSVFRRDDPARTNSLNAEHSKRYVNAMPNQKTVLQFDVLVHEVSHEPQSADNCSTFGLGNLYC